MPVLGKQRLPRNPQQTSAPVTDQSYSTLLPLATNQNVRVSMFSWTYFYPKSNRESVSKEERALSGSLAVSIMAPAPWSSFYSSGLYSYGSMVAATETNTKRICWKDVNQFT